MGSRGLTQAPTHTTTDLRIPQTKLSNNVYSVRPQREAAALQQHHKLPCQAGCIGPSGHGQSSISDGVGNRAGEAFGTALRDFWGVAAGAWSFLAGVQILPEIPKQSEFTQLISAPRTFIWVRPPPPFYFKTFQM